MTVKSVGRVGDVLQETGREAEMTGSSGVLHGEMRIVARMGLPGGMGLHDVMGLLDGMDLHDGMGRRDEKGRHAETIVPLLRL